MQAILFEGQAKSTGNTLCITEHFGAEAIAGPSGKSGKIAVGGMNRRLPRAALRA